MTKLTLPHNEHHNYTIPQHEIDNPSSRREISVVHRQTLSPRQAHPQKFHTSQEGYASSPIAKRNTSEPRIDKAEDTDTTTITALQGRRKILNAVASGFDRMSGHDPSSGDGEEDAPSPDYATSSNTHLKPAQAKQQRKPSTPNIRPPTQAGSKSVDPTIGRPSSSKAGNVQSGDGRQIAGQSHTTLPAVKVFPVQVGSEIFRLSGASISSDAPSYFTQWFEEQVRQNEETGGVKTLYIDRDPETFRDIARHLQGYYIKPRDGPHFVRLFADAQFYSLPRLISQLFESEIFIQIGERHFQIPKDIFCDPGNSPNYFSLGFAVFFSTPGEVFPGLDRRGLLRPPPINPPCVQNRSSEIFDQLLHLLRGYPLHIRDETHRQELLRDCKYFNLRGLEQRIVAHDISYNLERNTSEICMRLNDLKPSGISYRPDEGHSTTSVPAEYGWVHYARPFVDEQSYELIVEIGGDSTILDLDEMRVDFHGKTKARVSSLFQVVANKMGLPSNQPLGLIMLSGGATKRSPSPGHSSLSEDRVRVRFETISDITLDNAPLDMDWETEKGRHMRVGTVSSIALNDDVEDPSSTSDDPRSVASQTANTTQRSNQRSSATAPTKSSRSQPPTSAQSDQLSAQPLHKKRKVEPSNQRFGKWVIRNGQWRIRVEPSTNTARGAYEIVFIAVKIDAFTSELARNARRQFLG